MPKAKKKAKKKARPPRLYFDKAKSQYFIRIKRKKIFYPKGSDPKKIMEELLKKVRTTEPTYKEPIFYDKPGKAPKEPKGFRGKQYKWTGRYTSDPPLVSYGSLDPTTQRALQKQAENSAEAERKAAEASAATKARALANEESEKKIAALQSTSFPIDDLKAILATAGLTEQQIKDYTADTNIPINLTPGQKASVTRRVHNAVKASEAENAAEEKQRAEDRAEADMTAEQIAVHRGVIPSRSVLRNRLALGNVEAETTPPPVGRTRQLVAVGQQLAAPEEAAAAAARADNLETDMLPVAAAAAADVSQGGQGQLEDQVNDVGLYSDQIMKMMKDYVKDGFLGVVAADEVHLLAKKSLPHDKFGFVMNKDPSNKPGSHWLAVYVDTVDDKEVDYYDSYAEEPDDLFLAELKKLMQAHKLSIYLKFKVNRVKSQAENSNLCGFHAMKFLMDRFAGKPFIDASGWSDVRKREHEAKELMQKFDRFGYI